MAGWMPYIAIVTAQVMFSGMAILSKTAFNGGMNTSIFIFYRQGFAALFLVPFAVAATTWTSPPPLPPKLLFKIFILAFLGLTINLNVYAIGIKYTTATVASATTNSIPVISFLLSVLVGVESIRLRSFSGIAKVFGIALFIWGVIIIAFYKGPALKPTENFQLNFNGSSNGNSDQTWITGSLLMVCSAIIWTLWIVLQVMILKEYPSSLLFITLSSLFSAIQSFLVAIVAERRMSEWKLHLDQELLAVAYSGIFAAGIGQYLQSWCNDKKGPVFVAMFTPLAFVFTITFTSIFFGEVIILGSVLGGVLMAGGLYSVLWGKKREIEENLSNDEEGSAPFLSLYWVFRSIDWNKTIWCPADSDVVKIKGYYGFLPAKFFFSVNEPKFRLWFLFCSWQSDYIAHREECFRKSGKFVILCYRF